MIRRMEIIGTSSEKMKTGDHVSIDIYKLGKTMREELEILHPLLDDCCIYRVPKRLRVLNEKAYTPQVVSIGPLHHGREELKAMEECKRRYLKDFLAWSELSLEDLIGVTEMEETRLRNCYAEAIELSSDVFVKMMLLDAAFIIMIMLKNYFLDFQSSNDRIFSRPWMIHDIRFDMILLENQLPFFFLNDLLKLSKPYKGYSLIEFTHGFLKGALGSWVTDNILNGINSSEVQHFVDFLRICHQPTKLPQPRKLKTLNMPSAAELRQAGVKFKLGSSKNLFDVKFNKSRGRLEIPRLLVIDQTEILFRNLQAFEQCNCSDKYVTNYITMINLLVCSTRDVEMLVRKGIIENWLRDNDAVLSVVHNLDKENLIFLDNFYFSEIVEDLNKYCRKRRHKWKASLKQNYFRNPWAIISVIAAAILLMLTVIQTVCSIIQVV